MQWTPWSKYLSEEHSNLEEQEWEVEQLATEKLDNPVPSMANPTRELPEPFNPLGAELTAQEIKPLEGCLDYELQLGALVLYEIFNSRHEAFTDLVH